MTQEQLKDQFVEYYKNNLNNLTALEAIKEIIDAISSDLYYDGFVNVSNKLATASLIIGGVASDN